VPLFVLAIGAQRAATSWKRLRSHLPRLRRVAGLVLGATTLAIAIGLFDPLQRALPGYTATLENRIESGQQVTKQLASLSGEGVNRVAANAAAPSSGAALPRLGRAPQLQGITAWLNTPAGRAVRSGAGTHKVELIDFWTYSCINCQRSIPHVEAWYRRYRADGLEVIGVHTPEFAFEHVEANVAAATRELGVTYPVALDDDYRTWDAFHNEAWPSAYLVDASGEIRAYDEGEGNYATMERDIRQLLAAEGVRSLPPPTDLPDATPKGAISPESYLGYAEASNDFGTAIVRDAPGTYERPSFLPVGDFAYEGDWSVHAEEATARSGAMIGLSFVAHDVYLLVGGEGTLRVSTGSSPARTFFVNGPPRLYRVLGGAALRTGELTIGLSPGLLAYSLTFG
jgi:thiol-disulfide isomerase/thioredoxin